MEEELKDKLGAHRVKINEDMKLHTNMKVGGPADFYFEAENEKDLVEAVKKALDLKIHCTVIGNGANVLVSDEGIRGLVIVNKSEKINFLSDGLVEVESGVDNTSLIREAAKKGLSGMERLMKVPGTIGGAVYMNAGDTGKKEFFGDLVKSVKVIDKKGNIKTLLKDDCDFAYRSSRFQDSGEVILSVKIKLEQVDPKEIEKRTRDILVRKAHHPAGATVGSTFKNPENYHSGELIEKAGLKGKKIGGAKISEKHANFIINEGDATAADVKKLIDLMKKTVKEKFDVDLEEEVRYIGEW
ncbi:UDP-N-acetylmuramate dehydrogenase [Patescibacteria group bacterium]|nr:UDP-N-acetylmuramate dehydrogenase [Patescibacteria group bacterium]